MSFPQQGSNSGEDSFGWQGPQSSPPNNDELMQLAQALGLVAGSSARISSTGNASQGAGAAPVYEPIYGDAADPVPQSIRSAVQQARQQSQSDGQSGGQSSGRLKTEVVLLWATNIQPETPKLGLIDSVLNHFNPSDFSFRPAPGGFITYTWIPRAAYPGQPQEEFQASRLTSHAKGLLSVKFSPSRDHIGGGQEGDVTKVYAGWGVFMKPAHEQEDEQDVTRVKKVVIKTMIGNPQGDDRQYEGRPPLQSVCPLEFLALAALRPHPGIVYLYDFMAKVNQQNGQRLAFLEYLQGEPVVELARRWMIMHQTDSAEGYVYQAIPEVVVKGIFIQTAQALQFMHYHGFAHNHLCNDNLMADKHGTYKLIDFSLNVPALSGHPLRSDSGGGSQDVWHHFILHRHHVSRSPEANLCNQWSRTAGLRTTTIGHVQLRGDALHGPLWLSALQHGTAPRERGQRGIHDAPHRRAGGTH